MQQSKRGSIIGSWVTTIDKYMLSAIIITIVFSIIMVTTASPAVAERIGLPPFYFIQRQLVYLFIGLIVMLSISFFSFEVIRKFAVLGFILFIILI